MNEESMRRLRELLDEIDEIRARLENTPDLDTAIDDLAQINERAKAAQAALERARQEAT